MQVAHVGGHARHQTRGAELVNVSERERLDVVEHGAAQVGGKAGGRHGREAPGKDAHGHTHRGKHQHEGAVAINGVQVVTQHTTVNNPCGDIRNEHPHDDLKGGENGGEAKMPHLA